MDLVNKSGKFDKKFEAFTGKQEFFIMRRSEIKFPFIYSKSFLGNNACFFWVVTLIFVTGSNDPLGKRLNNSKTRQELGWQPKYPSFAQFLETL